MNTKFTGEDWFSVGEVLSEGGKSKPSKGPATQDEFPFVDTPATPPAATKIVKVAPPTDTEGAEGGEDTTAEAPAAVSVEPAAEPAAGSVEASAEPAAEPESEPKKTTPHPTNPANPTPPTGDNSKAGKEDNQVQQASKFDGQQLGEQALAIAEREQEQGKVKIPKVVWKAAKKTGNLIQIVTSYLVKVQELIPERKAHISIFLQELNKAAHADDELSQELSGESYTKQYLSEQEQEALEPKPVADTEGGDEGEEGEKEQEETPEAKWSKWLVGELESVYKGDELKEAYKQISEALGQGVDTLRHVVQDLQDEINNLDDAARKQLLILMLQYMKQL